MQQDVIIDNADPRSDAANALLRASAEFMRSLYPDDWCHVMSGDELAGPGKSFYIARLGDKAVGCGALVIRDRYCELKSLYVNPMARKCGIGRRILNHILNEAKHADQSIVRLETGYDLQAATDLYNSVGFQKCPAFGGYPDVPESLFMELRL